MGAVPQDEGVGNVTYLVGPDVPTQYAFHILV